MTELTEIVIPRTGELNGLAINPVIPEEEREFYGTSSTKNEGYTVSHYIFSLGVCYHFSCSTSERKFPGYHIGSRTGQE